MILKENLTKIIASINFEGAKINENDLKKRLQIYNDLLKQLLDIP